MKDIILVLLIAVVIDSLVVFFIILLEKFAKSEASETKSPAFA